MRLDPKGQLFIGFKIDSKLREAMGQATPGDRKFFEGSAYLQILSMGDDQWVGKVFDTGIAPSEIEDLGRNVVSLLNRIAPAGRHSPSLLRIFGVAVEVAAVAAPPPPPPRDPRDY